MNGGHTAQKTVIFVHVIWYFNTGSISHASCHKNVCICAILSMLHSICVDFLLVDTKLYFE